MTVALVPDPPLDLTTEMDRLVGTLRPRSRWVILTGAGISTESGIPDYRGPETARRARNPIKFQEFTRNSEARARYWARATAGWGRVREAVPNGAHQAIAGLENQGRLVGTITQNVDRLHQQAGLKEVIELHGSLYDVRCLKCGKMEGRDSLQMRLRRVNVGWRPDVDEVAPDGDAVLEDRDVQRFRVVGCLSCGGDLKPDVVFFGENVPRWRVEKAYAWVDEADALVVVGSSLTVFSGFRFLKRAHSRGIPVVVVNVGPTRGDPLATVKVEGRAGLVLPALAEALRA